jgi:hypothetical protein
MRLLMIFAIVFALLIRTSFTQDATRTEPVDDGQVIQPTPTKPFNPEPTRFKREPMVTARVADTYEDSTEPEIFSTAYNPTGGGSDCPQRCLAKAATSVGCGSL